MRDQDELRTLRDRDGVALPDALAAHDVELDRMSDERQAARLPPPRTSSCTSSRAPCSSPCRLPLGAVLGTFGVERHRVTFRGQAAHAGSTPMAERRDALAGAARLELEIREIAARDGRRRRLHDGERRDEAGHRHGRRRGGRLPARPAQPRRRSPRRDARRREGRERALRRRRSGSTSPGSASGASSRSSSTRRSSGSATRRFARSPARRTGCRAARSTTRPRSRAPAFRP